MDLIEVIVINMEEEDIILCVKVLHWLIWFLFLAAIDVLCDNVKVVQDQIPKGI